MGFGIVTIAPFWFVFICILAAAFLTWLLYRKHHFENKKLLIVMKALRFAGLFLLFVLLLSPILKLKLSKEKKPALLVYVDRSASMDSVKSAQLVSYLKSQENALEAQYDIRYFDFAAEVYQGAEVQNRLLSKLGAVPDHINSMATMHSKGVAVLVSDGIMNTGLSPLFKTVNANFPVFTIGLGDSAEKADVWVQEVHANSTVFLGNDFTVTIDFRATKLNGQSMDVQLLENGKAIQTQKVRIDGDRFFGKAEFQLNAKAPGYKHYSVRIAPITGEFNLKNNAGDAYIQITDTRRNICIAYHAPHPDVGAIARSLLAFEQYAVVKLQYQSGALPDADLYILHGFASTKAEQNAVLELSKKRKPFWFIASGQSMPAFTQFESIGIAPRFQQGGFTEAQGQFVAGFSEYLIPEAFGIALKTWPPLKVSYGKYIMPVSFKPMLTQKIGAVGTDYPLLGLTAAENSRQAWLWGEGIWRWRIQDYTQNGNFELFDRWAAGLIQYLTTQDVKQKFVIFPSAMQFEKNQQVVVFGEYTDLALNMDNKAKAMLQIRGDKGLKKEILFARSGKRYRADLGALPSGEYELVATHLGTSKETAVSRFTVTDRVLELEKTVADFGLLRNMASRNQGAYFGAAQAEQCVKTLLNRKDARKVLYYESTATAFIHIKWIFLAIILLFTAEWFLRKREGGY